MGLKQQAVLRKSSLCLAIGVALGSGWAQAIDVGTEQALRDAISTSEASITVTSNITLTADLPRLLVDTSIDGGGFVLDGGGNVCIDARSTNLTVNNLTLRGCVSTRPGGAIFASDADVSLTNSIVSGNRGSRGGGIYVDKGQLTLASSIISDNTALGSGGGINFFGTDLVLIDSIVTGNAAGGNELDGGGGGIELTSNSNLTANGSTISNNATTGSGGGLRGYYSIIELTDSTVSGNTATVRGGGISLEFGANDLTVTRSSISANQTSGPGGGVILNRSDLTLVDSMVTENIAADGGGIELFGRTDYEPLLTISKSTIAGNQVSGVGGGVRSLYSNTVLTDSTISGNLAEEQSGGVHLVSGTHSIINTTISGNQTPGIDGGLSVLDGEAVPINATIKFSTITANSAGGGAGGMAFTGTGSGSELLGVILVGNSAPTNSDLSGNIDFSYGLLGVAPNGFVPGAGSLVGVDPLLGPLADNGGPTQTHLPSQSCRAAALVPLDQCGLDFDQRGTSRPQGDRCSAGSVEVALVPAVFLSTATLPDGDVGEAYNATLESTCGVDPYSYALALGSQLPAGLTLNTNGAITGVPTESGSFPFSATVTDDEGLTDTKEYSMTVVAAVEISTATLLPDGIRDEAYTATLESTGGVGPYSYALTSGSQLPAGLTLNTDGTITGSPIESDSFTFSATVTDADGRTATEVFTLTIMRPDRPDLLFKDSFKRSPLNLFSDS